jgi:hypothetical protein
MRAVTIGLAFLLLAPRCEAQVEEASLRIGNIEFTSRVTIVAGTHELKTLVRATNEGSDTTRLLAPASCALSLRIYRERWSDSTPLWDGRRKERVCSEMLRVFTIPPKSSVDFVEVDSLDVVRKQVVPARLYHFSAVLSVGRGGKLEMPAGSAELR